MTTITGFSFYLILSLAIVKHVSNYTIFYISFSFGHKVDSQRYIVFNCFHINVNSFYGEIFALIVIKT